MILRWFQTTFLTPKVQPQSPGSRVAPETVKQSRVQNIYPPDDPGLPIRDHDYLLAGNAPLLNRLKLHAATSEAIYDQRFIKPIQRVAQHLSALPATSTSLFSGEGGLFCASIELAFLSYQASDGRIFTGDETVERRHKLEPRWRYFCFAAALLYPLGRPLSTMIVTSAKGEAWPKHHLGLWEWAQDKEIDRIYVTWPDAKKGDSPELIGPAPYTAALLHKIIGPDNLAWLEEGSMDLTSMLFDVVSGSESTAKIAREVISSMWSKVKTREDARRPETYGRLTIGTHLTPYLVGAMRSLVDDGGWKPNEMPLLVDATGVYLVWPAAGSEIVQRGKRDGHDGWPASPSVLAELLKAAGVFDTSRGDDSGLVEVVDKNGELHLGFKLKNPHSVIEGYDPALYKKTAPKTLKAVLDADPLSKSEQAAQKPVTPKPVAEKKEKAANPTEATAPKLTIDMDTGEITGLEATPAPQGELLTDSSPADDLVKEIGTGELSVTDTAATSVESEPVARATPAAPADATPATKQTPAVQSQTTASVREGPQIKFSDLVPEDVRKDMKSPLSIELLGKVIKTWREKGEDSQTMRMTDNGAAFSLDLLTSMIRSVPDWVNDIGAAGLVYTAPSMPGLKIMKVAIPEGSPKLREAIVISRYGCKKLGL